MMDDGKTLGRRIMIEATICKDAPAGSVMSRKAWTDLRSLCATADACERLVWAAEKRVEAEARLGVAERLQEGWQRMFARQSIEWWEGHIKERQARSARLHERIMYCRSQAYLASQAECAALAAYREAVAHG